MTTLKIDRSFVHNCHSEPNKNAIVSTILSMGLHLDLNVVAEGIETEDEYRFLANRDCHTGQGYFIERPLNEDAFELLLKQQAQTTKKAERKKNAS